jgi:hypothetical protein
MDVKKYQKNYKLIDQILFFKLYRYMLYRRTRAGAVEVRASTSSLYGS